MKANLRRHYSQPAQETNDESNEITIKDIVIYPDAYSIKKRGGDIELTHVNSNYSIIYLNIWVKS